MGSHIAEGLVRAGHSVGILKRKISDIGRLSSILPLVELFDIEDGLEKPFRKFRHVDVIIHAATLYGRGRESASLIAETNILFPLRLLENALDNNVELFLNIDSFFTKKIENYSYLRDYTLSKKHFNVWAQSIVVQKKIKFLNVVLEHLYGPGDDQSKFTNWFVRQCVLNEAEINLTDGTQERDFIFVEDAVSAIVHILRNSDALQQGWSSIGLGSGHSVSVRYFSEMAHRLAASASKLNFGTLPARNDEIMCSCADTTFLKKIGWSANFNLENGVLTLIDAERSRF